MGSAIAAVGAYLRRHHVGLLALFVALGGTAYAVEIAPKNSVVSKSIKTNAVKSPDIRAGAVKGSELAPGSVDASKLATAQTFEFPAEVIIADGSPSVPNSFEVRVPASGAIQLFLTADVRMSFDAGGLAFCTVGIDLPPVGGSALPLVNVFAETDNYQTYRSAPGPERAVVFPHEAGFLTLTASPGPRTFRLVYSGNSANCRFRNSEIIVVPVV